MTKDADYRPEPAAEEEEEDEEEEGEAEEEDEDATEEDATDEDEGAPKSKAKAPAKAPAKSAAKPKAASSSTPSTASSSTPSTASSSTPSTASSSATTAKAATSKATKAPAKPRAPAKRKVASAMVVTPHAPAAAAAAGAGKKAAPAAPKAPKPVNLNENLTKPLTEVALQEKAAGEVNKFIVYMKAIRALSEHPTKIQSGAEAKKLSGIGDKIAAKVQEILDTGTLQRVANSASGQAAAAAARAAAIAQAQANLGELWLLPPSKVADLGIAGITTLDKLRQDPSALSAGEQAVLQHWDDLKLRAPRSEVQQIGDAVCQTVRAADPTASVTICGEHRHGATDSAAVVVVLAPGDAAAAPAALLAETVSALHRNGLVVADALEQPTKYCGIVRAPGARTHRRLELRAVSASAFACAVLWASHDEISLLRLTQHATTERFALTDDALRPIGSTGYAGTPVPLATDHDIYAYLRLPVPAT